MVTRTEIVALPLDTPPADLLERVPAEHYTRIPIYSGSIDDESLCPDARPGSRSKSASPRTRAMNAAPPAAHAERIWKDGGAGIQDFAALKPGIPTLCMCSALSPSS